ncbi:hypothetical protein A256_27738 [Pseudomonas syringae pv. actinidiae ICMP 19103]|nr:hypothetical protein A256_27738 [Pseudomonas syringae pv. actinidiae ICMP 19103]EPM81458.1 hypothetical protein A260_28886 [Pseudomonas syringae pv. actinidiae ICMP 19068]EPM92014.1 hypothetical protein A259_37721 [Pseudomonas syringae pv. actinidiae ICMP 19070]EPM96121.1 hypothetical protein A258_14281 [Pseudomonas syringae pv. actinidiae ICMP 19104]EPN07081.1 hypothetical protein A252_27399 [Pseudomonas syringae pv. actinidiae ICMP 9855]
MAKDQFHAVSHRPAVDLTGSQATGHVVIDERTRPAQCRRVLAVQAGICPEVDRGVVREVARPAHGRDLEHQQVAAPGLLNSDETAGLVVLFVMAGAVRIFPPQFLAFEVRQRQ